MTDNNQDPDINAMFPQVNLMGPAAQEEPAPEAPSEEGPTFEEAREDHLDQQAAMRAQLIHATLEALENTLEVSLACSLARVAFLAAASEAEEPSSFVTQTISSWVKTQKEVYRDAPAELKIQVWEKLEAYAAAQEQHFLGILEQE